MLSYIAASTVSFIVLPVHILLRSCFPVLMKHIKVFLHVDKLYLVLNWHVVMQNKRRCGCSKLSRRIHVAYTSTCLNLDFEFRIKCTKKLLRFSPCLFKSSGLGLSWPEEYMKLLANIWDRIHKSYVFRECMAAFFSFNFSCGNCIRLRIFTPLFQIQEMKLPDLTFSSNMYLYESLVNYRWLELGLE